MERQRHCPRVCYCWWYRCAVSSPSFLSVRLIDLSAPHRNKNSKLSPLAPFLPIPKYFESEWSYAQYRLPTQAAHISLSQTSIRTPGRDPDVADEERCVVGWVAAAATPGGPLEHQLVALTWTGGWYRLALPVPAPASATQRTPLSASPPTHSPLLPPSPSRPPSTIQSGRMDKGKGKERDKENEKSRSACTLQEFRKFGRFDGWL